MPAQQLPPRPNKKSYRRSLFPKEQDDGEIFRETDRGAPGDGALIAMTQKSPQETAQNKRRSQFYGNVFAVREGGNADKEKISRDAPLIIELKTNVIVCSFLSFVFNYLPLC
jgi:hypothetical protein